METSSEVDNEGLRRYNACMKNMTNDELIAFGLQVQQWRKKGGVAVREKFGKKHFSMLGKLSALARSKAKKSK